MIRFCNMAVLFLRLLVKGNTENGSMLDVWHYCYLLSRTLTGRARFANSVREVSVDWHDSILVISVFYECAGPLPPFVVRSYTGNLAGELYRRFMVLSDDRVVVKQGNRKGKR